MPLFGLIGNPLGHSRSQEYFRARFKTDHLTGYDYLPFPLESIDRFPALLEKYPSLEGVNVTIPYKESIIPYLDTLSSEAKQIGAVNVVLIRKTDEKIVLEGHNTDAQGFQLSLPEHFPYRRALVLGTGGASKAVCFALNGRGIKAIKVGRKPGADNVISYRDLEMNFRELAQESIIINTTPLGMYPEIGACPPVPYDLINESMYLYDLIYNPSETLFLNYAKKKGIPYQNGEQMFLKQAGLAYQLFFACTT